MAAEANQRRGLLHRGSSVAFVLILSSLLSSFHRRLVAASHNPPRQRRVRQAADFRTVSDSPIRPRHRRRRRRQRPSKRLTASQLSCCHTVCTYRNTRTKHNTNTKRRSLIFSPRCKHLVHPQTLPSQNDEIPSLEEPWIHKRID